MPEQQNTHTFKEKEDLKVKDSHRDLDVDQKNKIPSQKPDLNILNRTVINPLKASPSAITMLHRTAGNAAVMRIIQRKLSVGSAEDSCEREADYVAEKVINTPDSNIKREAYDSSSGEISIRRKSETGLEESLSMQNPMDGFDVDSHTENRISSSKGGGSPLAGDVRAFMEPRFGADFSGVHIHTNNEAAELNREFSANAFTHGKDIYMGAGSYNPGTEQGKKLLAHELTHVVQQTGSGQRAVVSTMRIKAVNSGIRRDMKVVDALITEHAGIDDKIGLFDFYKDLSPEQQKIAAQYVITKGQLKMGDKVPEEIDDKAFRKRILSFVRSKFDWDVFSDAIRFAKASESAEVNENPTSSASSKNVTSSKTGLSSTAGTVSSGLLSVSNKSAEFGNKLTNLVTNINATTQGAVAATGSALGAAGSFMEAISKGQELSSSSSAMTGTQKTMAVSSIGASLADSGRNIATTIQAGNISQNFDYTAHEAIKTGTQASAVTAAGILAIVAGVYYTISGIRDFYLGTKHEEGLKATEVNALKKADAKREHILKSENVIYKQKLIIEDAKAKAVILGNENPEGMVKDLVQINEAIISAQNQIKDVEAQIENDKKVIKEEERLATIASTAGGTESLKKTISGSTAVKGALMIAGGVTLLAAAASPAGWIILVAAGIVGAAAAIYKAYKKWKQKKEIVDKYLDLEHKKQPREDNDTARDRLLQKLGFNTSDQCYNAIVNQMAVEAFERGVVNGDSPENSEYKKLIEDLGLKISADKTQPTAEQIAKKIHL